MDIRNRWFALLAGLLTVVLALGAACGGDDDEADGDASPVPGDTTTAGDGRAPADQQKLTYQTVEPQYLDPHRSNFEQDIGMERMLFRGLYNLRDDGEGGVEVVAAMAAGEPAVEGNVYTVKLKAGLKWSDGEPLTAADFVYGWKRGCDPAIGANYGYLLGTGFLDVKGCAEAQVPDITPEQKQAALDAMAVTATDETTFVAELNQPNGRFTTIASLWITFPAREDVVSANPDNWWQPATIVGNGPYVLEEFVTKDHATLTPNPNWSGDAPAIRELTARFFDDFSATYRAYQTGELDITRIQETDVAVAEDDPELRDAVLLLPSGRIDTIHMYIGESGPAVLKDFNVRLAISRSIDRETLNDVVFNGVNAPATYWVVKGLTGHQGNEAFDDIIGYDAAAAKAALAEAGFPDGQGFPTLTLLLREDPVQRNIGDFLVKGWKDTLGITVELEFVDGPTRSARFTGEDYELFRGGWQLDYPDIENPLLGLFNTGGGNNHYGCSDPEIDAAFDEAIEATSDEARVAAYQKAETLIIQKLCGVAPFAQLAQPFLIRPTIGGVHPNGTVDAGTAGNHCVECWFVKAES